MANDRRRQDQQALATVAEPARPQGNGSALMTLADANAALERDLARRDDELARKLAGSFPADYFMGLVLTQVRKLKPDVQQALASTPQGRASLVAACYLAAELHLPFLMGRMWLVPRKNGDVQEVQAMVGYQGLVDLITAPGTGVTYVDAAVVYAKDDFDFERGTNAYLRHRAYRPDIADNAKQADVVVDRGPRTHVWAQVVYANGQTRFDVMTYAEVEAIRKRGQGGGPWTTDWDEMGKKTVLRRLAKTQRISLDAMRVIEREDDWERQAAEQPAQDDQQAALRRRLQAQVGARPQTAQGASQGTQDQDDGDPGPAPDSVPAATQATVDEAAHVGPTATQHQPQAAATGGPSAQAAAQCGATLQDDDNVWTCTMAPRHRGVHTDGQHDWPQGM